VVMGSEAGWAEVGAAAAEEAMDSAVAVAATGLAAAVAVADSAAGQVAAEKAAEMAAEGSVEARVAVGSVVAAENSTFLSTQLQVLPKSLRKPNLNRRWVSSLSMLQKAERYSFQSST